MNRQTACLLMMVLCLPLSTTQAQLTRPSSQELPSVDQIIDLHIKSLGGRAVLEKVKNMKTKASMSMQSPFGEIKMDISIWQSGKKSLTIINSEQSGQIKQGSDGNTYWAEVPQIGPRILTGAEKAMMEEQQGSVFPVLDWKNYAGKITVLGKETVNSSECYKVEFALKAGPKLTRFFDSRNGRLVKITSNPPGLPATAQVQVFPSDFRTVSGITIPFKQRTLTPNPPTGGQLTTKLQIDDLQINTAMAEGIFALPESVKKIVNEKK